MSVPSANVKCNFTKIEDPCELCLRLGKECNADSKKLGEVGRRKPQSQTYLPGQGLINWTRDSISRANHIDLTNSVIRRGDSQIPDSLPHEIEESGDAQKLRSPRATIARYYEKRTQCREELMENFVSTVAKYTEMTESMRLEIKGLRRDLMTLTAMVSDSGSTIRLTNENEFSVFSHEVRGESTMQDANDLPVNYRYRHFWMFFEHVVSP